VFTAHQIGGASAAVVAGTFRVNFGDYMFAFMLSGTLCVLAAIAALFIGGGKKAPDQAKPAVAATA
jgi:sugar phosphate permease